MVWILAVCLRKDRPNLWVDDCLANLESPFYLPSTKWSTTNCSRMMTWTTIGGSRVMRTIAKLASSSTSLRTWQIREWKHPTNSTPHPTKSVLISHLPSPWLITRPTTRTRSSQSRCTRPRNSNKSRMHIWRHTLDPCQWRAWYRAWNKEVMWFKGEPYGTRLGKSQKKSIRQSKFRTI